MDSIRMIKSKIHRNLVMEIYEEVIRDHEAIGLLLQGSVARGESYETSDLDMYILLKEGLSRPFRADFRQGICVEFKYSDFEMATRKCEDGPMGMYNFLDSAILLDHEGQLQQLIEQSKQLFSGYRTPVTEMKSIKHWLESTQIKVKAAQMAGDDLKAAFVVGTTSWKILEGVWAASNKPMPPNGSVLFHLKDLEGLTDDRKDLIKSLFVGEVRERIESSIQIIEWVTVSLNDLIHERENKPVSSHTPVK
ncbi:DNA polymerase subunit beta [Paenibacillus sp. NPDC057934]|uniref:DNA polymerase subunit beta n=1 Tax=Paenibacillus sp. NPDC057934 TaxID=3346282 RepID=UPI0036DEF0B5